MVVNGYRSGHVLIAVCIYVISDSVKYAVCLPSQSPNGNISVAVNSSFTMTCLYDGLVQANDSYIVSWFRGNQSQGRVNQDCDKRGNLKKSDYNVSCPDLQKQSLTINRVNLTYHETVWRCEVARYLSTGVVSNKSTDFGTITVNVPVSSVEVTEPSVSTCDVTEGTPKRFVCKTSPCRPQAVVTWFKQSGNGNEGRIGGTVTETYSTVDNDLIVTRSTLYYNSSRTDQNNYIYCKASNPDSQTVISALRPQVNVLYPPDDPPGIKDHGAGSIYSVIENTTMSLTCILTGGNPRSTLTWSCNSGEVMDESSGNDAKLKVMWTAERNKDGPCICTSYHPASAVNTSVRVNVEILYPPSIPIIKIAGVNRTQTMKIINSTNVPVTCSSYAKPPPVYTWQYKGTSTTGNSSFLKVTENGSAICTASNTMTASTGVRSSSSEIVFHILYGPTSPDLSCMSDNQQQPISDDSVDVIDGGSLTLKCSANGDPTPAYSWNTTSQDTVTTNSIHQDNLEYMCTARNTLRPDYGPVTPKSATNSVRITRLYGPRIAPTLTYTYSDGTTSSLQSQLNVLENTSFSVICNNSDSRPSPTYEWHGDQMSSTGSLEISGIKRSSMFDNNGLSYYQYTCIVQNVMTNTCGDKRTDIRTLNETLKIYVLYPASIQRLDNQSVLEGRDFTLQATVRTHGSPRETYTWSYNGMDNSGRDVLVHELTHTMNNISRRQAGVYTLEAINRINQTGKEPYLVSIKQAFYLTVFYTTTVTNFTIDGRKGSVTINETQTGIIIRCGVDSNPASDMHIEANTYNGETRLVEAMSSSFVNHTVQPATCFDAGVYRCVGKNNYTSSPASQETMLFVRCTPRPRYPFEQNTTVYKALKESVTLNLTVIAYPEPKPADFTWAKRDRNTTTVLKDGHNMKINSTTLQSSITIYNLTENNFGQYILMIINAVHEYYFNVRPKDKPEMPKSFSHVVEHLSQRAAVFKWEPGFNGGLHQVFYILYKTSTDTVWQHEEVSEPKTNVTLTGLEPGTLYSVKMFASNPEGNSSETIELHITTVQPATPTSSNLGSIIGGVAGACAGVGVVVVIMLLIRRRKRYTKNTRHEADYSRENLHGRNIIYDDNGMEINQAYVSTDSLGIDPQVESARSDVYAKVNKERKNMNTDDANTYAVVDKTRKPVGDSSGQGDLYATPVKKKDRVKPKPTKEKKANKKDKKGKKSKLDNRQDQDTYENAQELNVYSNVHQKDETTGENVYENRQEYPVQKRNLNKDGLLYADLTFQNNDNGKKTLVIHGLENTTDYITVDFTKKAEPLPDSDEEGDNT